ncbi:MAG: hypothetical protein ACRCWW_12360 [Scandinavium sp.]|uniref:hypothetical protein n=1 Tax=Scandinavium sp. TaxID=2830653 RepID=UPI003F3D9430
MRNNNKRFNCGLIAILRVTDGYQAANGKQSACRCPAKVYPLHKTSSGYIWADVDADDAIPENVAGHFAAGL